MSRQMLRAKKENRFNSCPIADSRRSEADTPCEEETTKGVQLERDQDELKKLQEMSELQLAILTELMPVSPCAIHSEVLLDTLAPFLKTQRKKDRRREFEAAVAPLVEEGFVRYFCCFIDSYAINPQRTRIASYLTRIAENCPRHQSI
ncbi:MAG TPA: hypothetical protein VEF35_01835 [Candidatus Bathyarchaeia archaeon]|nr:hypothetical protein [Candidatus Bathyarchaeia archaeon]